MYELRNGSAKTQCIKKFVNIHVVKSGIKVIIIIVFVFIFRVPAPGRVSLYKAGGLTDVSDEGIYTCNISGNTVYAGIYTVHNYNDGV